MILRFLGRVLVTRTFIKRDFSMKAKSLGLGVLLFTLAGCGGFKSSKVGSAITLIAPQYTNQTSVEVHGKCDPKQEDPVTLSGNFVGSPLTALCEEKAFTATIPLHEEQTTVVAQQAEATAEATIIFDDVPPVVAVTFPVPGGVIGSNVYVSGTCESGLDVELDGDMNRSVKTKCENGQFIANVVMNLQPASGPRALRAEQTDLAGNVGDTSASYTFDNTVPGNPSLTLTVTNPYTGANPVISTDTSPVLSGSVTGAENGRVYVHEASNCNDFPKATIVVPSGGALNTTLNYSSTGEDDGVHRYYARAVGANGVASPTSCLNTQQSYRLDTQPPNVTLSSHAEGARVRAGVQQTFRGACETGLPLTFKMGLSTTTLTCSNKSYSYKTNMPNDLGPLVITFSQTDLVGNSYTGTRNIEITSAPDNTPPEIHFINLSDQDQLTKGQIFSLTGLCEADLPIQILGTALVSPVTAQCSSSGVFTTNINITQNTGSNLVVEARQSDLSGNAAKHSVRVRVINADPGGGGNGPIVNILSPLASSNYSVGTPIVVSGMCTPNLLVTISGMALEDGPVTRPEGGPAYTTACTGGGTYSLTATVSSDPGQELLVTVSQTDGVNTSEYSAPINVLLAPTHPSPPPVKLASPLDSSVYNVGSQVLVAGTCAYGLPVSISGSAITMNKIATCSNSGTFFEIMEIIGSEKNKASITASQVNSLGEVGIDLANLDIVKDSGDSTPPNITITSPANNSSHNVSSIINVGGTCEGSFPVTVMGTAISGFHEVLCNAGAYSIPVPSSNIASNSLSILVQQADLAGNMKVVSRTVRLTVPQDSTPPSVQIAFPTDGITVNRGSALVVMGYCEEGLNVTLTGTALESSASVVCEPSGTFSKVLNVSSTAAVGRTIIATQRDAANNSGQSTVTLNVGSSPNTTAPNVSITNPSESSSHQSSTVVSINGSCQSGRTVYVTGSALTDSVTAQCNGGSYITGAVTSASGGNSLDIIAYQIDGDGNMGVTTRKINVFVVANPNPPELSVDYPISGETFGRGGNIIVSGGCQPGYQVSISGTALASSHRISCSSGGAYSLITKLRNSAANNASIVASQRDRYFRLTSAFTQINVSSQPAPPAPEISIVNPSQGSVLDAGAATTIQGICVTGGSEVYVMGTALGKTITTPCNANSFSVTTNIIPYTQMNSSLIIAQINGGALSYDSKQVDVQRPPVPVPPVVAITAPNNNSTIVQGTKVNLTGTCTAGLAVSVEGTAITGPRATGCSSSGTFSTQITMTTAIGTNKTLIASQVNIAGQQAQATRNINIIATPVLSIKSPLAGNSFIRGVSISVDGDCRPGVNVVITGSAITSSVTRSCGVDGTYSGNVNLVTAVANNLKIDVQQAIAQGYNATSSVTINTINPPVNPEVTISDPEHNSSHQSGSPLEVTGSCTAGYNVTVSGTGIANPVTTACTNQGRYVANVFVVSLPEPEEPEPPEDGEEEEQPPEEEEEEEDLVLRAQQVVAGVTGFKEINIKISTNSTITHCGSSAMRSCSAQGRGRSNNPYVISTYACLQNINLYSNRTCHYRIGKNITAPANSNWEPLGSYYQPFTGSIDGAGRIITGLNVNRPYDDAAALVAFADGADIKNLTLKNVTVRGKQFAGAFVGMGEDGTNIDNVHLRGKVSISASLNSTVGVHVGGIAGYNEGSIRNSSINGDGDQQSGQDDEVIELSASGSINTRYNMNAGHRVGGFAGEHIGPMSKNKVLASALRMTVTGAVSVNNNYDGNAGHRVGGIVGRISAGTSMSDNYIFSENSYDPGIVSPMVTGEMYVQNAGGLNGHRVGGLIGESGAGLIEKSFILGINLTDVAGSFTGMASGSHHRKQGHSVGNIVGLNLNHRLTMDKVYLELPEDIEDAPIDPVTGQPIYEIPELKLRVAGNNGVHAVGGIVGETTKANTFKDIYIQAAAMKIESHSNLGNIVGGLIGSIYQDTYSSTSGRNPRFYMTIGYITGLNSQIIADAGAGTFGNRLGGIIGRMAYTTQGTSSDRGTGFYLLGVAVDGFAQIQSYGTGNEHYVGGLVGQLIEPHSTGNSIGTSYIRRSFVSETAEIIAESPDSIVGGLLGEYRRIDRGEYSSSGSSLSRSFQIENSFSHVGYTVPATMETSPTAALGFLMGRCNVGNVNRSGTIAEVRNSYGAPISNFDAPTTMPRLGGVIGVATGSGTGPQRCNVVNSRYGHASGIPAAACGGGCSYLDVAGLTEQEMSVQSNFPSSWWIYNPPYWRMEPIPFLIVDEDMEPIEDP